MGCPRPVRSARTGRQRVALSWIRPNALCTIVAPSSHDVCCLSRQALVLNRDSSLLYSACHDGHIRCWRTSDLSTMGHFQGHTQAARRAHSHRLTNFNTTPCLLRPLRTVARASACARALACIWTTFFPCASGLRAGVGPGALARRRCALQLVGRPVHPLLADVRPHLHPRAAGALCSSTTARGDGVPAYACARG